MQGHYIQNEGQMILLDAKVSPDETFHPAVFFADSHDAKIQIINENNLQEFYFLQVRDLKLINII